MFTPEMNNEEPNLWAIEKLKGGILDLETENDIFMQFTGVEDNDGNEIYVGDILDIEGDGTAVVKQRKGFFSAIFMDKGDMLIMGHDVQSHVCKIIGNIYEDEYLLS